MAAAIQLAHKHGNSVTTHEHWCVTGLQIVNSVTPTLFFSIPIAQNKGVVIDLTIGINKSDYVFFAGGAEQYIATRGTGNVSLQGSPLLSIINTFTGVKPIILVTANTSTQAIDVTITGAPTYTINCFAHYDLSYNT